MVDQNGKEENVIWVCPYCRQRYTAPRTAGLNTRCQNCGKVFYTRGIEMDNRESRKLQEEIQSRRRREAEADKEHE